MGAIGLFATKITSKFGVLSQKACERLAISTGKNIVDRSNNLGRALNKAELEDVFVHSLPERCRPKILTTIDELKECMKKLGYTDEMIESQIQHMAAGRVPNGTQKAPIYIPIDNFEAKDLASIIAHELEHALETNNRIKGKFARKMSTFYLGIKCILNKNFLATIQNKAVKANDLQYALISDIATQLHGNITPTREGFAKALSTDEKGFIEKIKAIIRKSYDPTNRATERADYGFAKAILESEIPAYRVGGEVERYASTLGKNETSYQQAVSMVYEDTEKILQREKQLFIRNKLTGKLEFPLEYKYDKDLTRLITNEQDRRFVQQFMGSEEFQNRLHYNGVRNNLSAIPAVRSFLEKIGMKANDIGGSYIWDLKPEFLNNPKIINMMKLTDKNGNRIYFDYLSSLTKLSKEELNKILELAPAKGANGEFKYADLIDILQYGGKYNDSDNILKAIADIEVKGQNPYSKNMWCWFNTEPKKRIEIFAKLQDAAKKGQIVEEYTGFFY